MSTTTTTEESVKKRKTGPSKPSIPPRAIAPFTKGQPPVKTLYPLSNYTFTPRKVPELEAHELKEQVLEKEALKNGKTYKKKPFKNGQLPVNSSYMKQLKVYNDYHGTRRYFQFLILVAGEKEPIVLLFKDKQQNFVPGGYLDPDETEEQGAKRLLHELFDNKDEQPNPTDDFSLGEVVGRWWRTDLSPNVYPYLPRHVTRPKELIKVMVVNLPKNRNFAFPEVYKTLHPYLLVDLYDFSEPELKAIPLFLSRFSFEYVNDKGEVVKEITHEKDE